MTGQMIPVERKDGVTLYGKVLNASGKLGQFEVHSTQMSDNGNVYGTFKEARNRMDAMIGVKAGIAIPKPQKVAR